MQSFNDALFTMTTFSAKKSDKNNIAGWGKKSKNLKWPQNFLNYVLQWYLTLDQKNFAFISEIWVLMSNERRKMKKKSYIFKYFKKSHNNFWSLVWYN